MVKFIDGCISSSDSTRREEVSRILFKLLRLERECIALIKKKKERERMHCIILKLANFFKAIHLLLPVCSLKLGGSRAVLGRK